jgi:hypothetical protein
MVAADGQVASCCRPALEISVGGSPVQLHERRRARRRLNRARHDGLCYK